jgi:hypothetical protein
MAMKRDYHMGIKCSEEGGQKHEILVLKLRKITQY